jgi:hypothetical protein
MKNIHSPGPGTFSSLIRSSYYARRLFLPKLTEGEL